MGNREIRGMGLRELGPKGRKGEECSILAQTYLIHTAEVQQKKVQRCATRKRQAVCLREIHRIIELFAVRNVVSQMQTAVSCSSAPLTVTTLQISLFSFPFCFCPTPFFLFRASLP